MRCRRAVRVGIPVVVAAMVVACGGREAGPEFDLSRMTATASGLRYEDVVEGSGPQAQNGMRVTVHYTGWLLDGTKFDSSKDRGSPYPLSLPGPVIDGWNEGLVGMRVGGRRMLVIPPELGYGAGGSPPAIPPNATLVFEIDLLSVESNQ